MLEPNDLAALSLVSSHSPPQNNIYDVVARLDVKEMMRLLSDGASLNGTNCEGQSLPLQVFAYSFTNKQLCVDMLNVLWNAGCATFNTPQRFKYGNLLFPLKSALIRGNLPALTFLLDVVKVPLHCEGDSVLNLFVKNTTDFSFDSETLALLRILISRGAYLNLDRDPDCRTLRTIMSSSLHQCFNFRGMPSAYRAYCILVIAEGAVKQNAGLVIPAAGFKIRELDPIALYFLYNAGWKTPYQELSPGERTTYHRTFPRNHSPHVNQCLLTCAPDVHSLFRMCIWTVRKHLLCPISKSVLDLPTPPSFIPLLLLEQEIKEAEILESSDIVAQHGYKAVE